MNISIPRSFVTVLHGAEHVTNINLMNWSDEEIILLAGTTIGSIEPAIEVCQHNKANANFAQDNFVFSVEVVEEKRNENELPSHIAALAEKAAKHLDKNQEVEVKNLLRKHLETFADPNGMVGAPQVQ